MKLFLMGLLLSLSTIVLAKQPMYSRLRQRIVDDGNLLSIQIDGIKNGRTIHYDQTFDITGMSQVRKEILKYRAFRAAGIVLPLHEMPWCVGMAAGLVVVIGALLVVRYRAVKTTR
jgi:hypothetical protein